MLIILCLRLSKGRINPYFFTFKLQIMRKITLIFSLACILIVTIGLAQTNMNELLDRYEQHKNSPGIATEFFTVSELTTLSDYFQTTANPLPEAAAFTAGAGIVYGWEINLGYGTFDLASPNLYTTISVGSGTLEFESGGAIDPNDGDTAVVIDNAGKLWTVDVPTGVYTYVGDTGITQMNGLEYNPVDGILYGLLMFQPEYILMLVILA